MQEDKENSNEEFGRRIIGDFQMKRKLFWKEVKKGKKNSIEIFIE